MDSGSSGKAGASTGLGRADRDPLLPPPQRTMRKGLALAILVHVALVAGLALSVNWKSSDPPAVEAELYSSIPRTAAPRAQDTPPDPTPDPTPSKPTPPPPPAPAPAPTPPPPPPPPVRATPAPPPEVDPQIAIEQDKRKREQAQRDQQEKQEQQQKLAKAKADKDRAAKLEAARQQDQKDEQDRKDKLAADQREKALEQQKADKLAQQKAQQAQQLAQQQTQQAAKEKAAKEAQLREQREAQTLAAQREANLKRIMGQAGATGAENATGTAQRSSGPSSSYGGRVAARVKPNIVFGDDVPGNPSAEVSVTIGPDGTIIGSRITKPSGVKAWDDAVLRAVERTGTLPRDTDGRVPPSLVIAFRPHDL